MHNNITNSPSVNDTFQEASKVCVLAETFDLTQFHKYQKIVIDPWSLKLEVIDPRILFPLPAL